MSVNEYIGKVCPYCKSEFTANDDIVVCSSCDMPHHKDCWAENGGCTTFGCLGTIKGVDGSETSVTAKEIVFEDNPPVNNSNTIYCTQCGAPAAKTSAFCGSCGARLMTNVAPSTSPVYQNVGANPYANTANATYNQPQSTSPYQNGGIQQNPFYQQSYNTYSGYGIPGGADSDMVKLIGANSGYYVRKFDELKRRNDKISWNWPAFLVPAYWFIYRKMYGYGAACLVVALICSLTPLLSVLSLGGYIALGIFGNYIYMRELERKTMQAKSMTEPYKTQFVTSSGGTNSTAVILTVIGWIILSAMLSL